MLINKLSVSLVVQIYGRNFLFPKFEPTFFKVFANHHIFHSDGLFLSYIISCRLNKRKSVITSGNALYDDYFTFTIHSLEQLFFSLNVFACSSVIFPKYRFICIIPFTQSFSCQVICGFILFSMST